MRLFSKNTHKVKRLHTEEKIKQYVCNYCLKTFKEENDLTNHKAFHNIHLGDAFKSFNCNLCHKKFNNALNLEGHILDNHSPLSNDCMDNISDDLNTVKNTIKFDKEIDSCHLKGDPENVQNNDSVAKINKSSNINSGSQKSSNLQTSVINKSDRYEHLKNKYINGTSLPTSNLKVFFFQSEVLNLPAVNARILFENIKVDY